MICGAGALGAIVVSFCFEVVMRYAFNAPTSWANEWVSYFLCAFIFLMMPDITRTGRHVAVTLIFEHVPQRGGRVLTWVICCLCFLMCVTATWFTADETLRQFRHEVQIMAVTPIDKWYVSIFIPYGLGSSALYFLRMLNLRDHEARAQYIGQSVG